MPLKNPLRASVDEVRRPSAARRVIASSISIVPRSVWMKACGENCGASSDCRVGVVHRACRGRPDRVVAVSVDPLSRSSVAALTRTAQSLSCSAACSIGRAAAGSSVFSGGQDRGASTYVLSPCACAVGVEERRHGARRFQLRQAAGCRLPDDEIVGLQPIEQDALQRQAPSLRPARAVPPGRPVDPGPAASRRAAPALRPWKRASASAMRDAHGPVAVRIRCRTAPSGMSRSRPPRARGSRPRECRAPHRTSDR